MVYFNSIKVRLEHGVLIYQPQGAAFQFHKGAIRTREVNAFQRSSSSFQFHKGAIRTRNHSLGICDILPFQFHKGAIRTADCLPWNRCYDLHFNSIKVRLEHLFSTISSTKNLDFNSIKVRLEPIIHQSLPSTHQHFNSIKVRLERERSMVTTQSAGISIP